MAYTQTDLNNVQAAILSLATGDRVASLTIGGKTVQYGQAQLADLRALRTEIENQLQSGAGRRRFILTQTSKGL